MRAGEASLRFTLGIFNDVIPEINENFDLQLTDPVGGVMLGPQRSVTINVLNNDNAHGVIGFAEVNFHAYNVHLTCSLTKITLGLVLRPS